MSVWEAWCQHMVPVRHNGIPESWQGVRVQAQIDIPLLLRDPSDLSVLHDHTELLNTLHQAFVPRGYHNMHSGTILQGCFVLLVVVLRLCDVVKELRLVVNLGIG